MTKLPKSDGYHAEAVLYAQRALSLCEISRVFNGKETEAEKTLERRIAARRDYLAQLKANIANMKTSEAKMAKNRVDHKKAFDGKHKSEKKFVKKAKKTLTIT